MRYPLPVLAPAWREQLGQQYFFFFEATNENLYRGYVINHEPTGPGCTVEGRRPERSEVAMKDSPQAPAVDRR